jgi:NAD-dependent dihydropyrimidine dehydrogenase PreA subunit
MHVAARPAPIRVADVQHALDGYGLRVRGGFAAGAADGVPAVSGGGAGVLLLVGNVGSAMWPAFAAAPEARDGRPDPLDRWSRRIGDELAARFAARALFPFGGPPHHPFQRWAARAEPLHASPLGLLMHPEYGLWHAYRFALLLADVPVDLPACGRQEPASPCAACVARPCLSTCPVEAFDGQGYDVARCTALLRAQPDAPCNTVGCAARRACPHGAVHRYRPEHARFHMRAFVRARPMPAG